MPEPLQPSPQKLRPTYTFTQDKLDALKAIAPEAFADGKANWDALRETLGEHLEDEGAPAEHFGLSWPGKRAARRLAAQPSAGTLTPAPGQGVNEGATRHLYLEGDNLEVLKLLQKSYAGRVKLIYIDPPYNTGNDFVYNDNFTDPLEDYLRKTGQADEAGALLTSNPKASGRFHSNWLNMIYPRLLLARPLLREDGVIFVSIDDNEVHHLRQVLDEVFGAENFVSQFTVQSNPRGRQSERFVATVHEYVIAYARNASECELLGAELSEKQIKDYKYEDADGRKYRLLGLRQRGSASRREDRPNMYYEIYVDPKTKSVSLEPKPQFSEKVLPRKSTGEDGRWMWGREKVGSNLNLLEARLIEGRDEWDIFVRDYLRTSSGDDRTTKLKTIWADKEINYQNGTQEIKSLMDADAFSFPKPTSLLKRIVNMANDSEGIVFDFFSGSATTAQAVLEQNREDGGNRRFILVQLPEPTDNPQFPTIAEIGKERIRRVIARMQTETPQASLLPSSAVGSLSSNPDLGFKVFSLRRSHFRAWQAYTGEDVSQLEMLFAQAETPLTENWQPDDVLSEVLLIEGFPLDSTVRPLSEFRHNAVREVRNDACAHKLLVCLDAAIQAETIAALRPAPGDVFICLDSALTDEAKLRLQDSVVLKVI